MVGRQVSFWDAIVSSAMLVSGRVGNSDSSFLVPHVVNENVSRFQVCWWSGVQVFATYTEDDATLFDSS